MEEAQGTFTIVATLYHKNEQMSVEEGVKECGQCNNNIDTTVPDNEVETRH